MRNVYFLKNKAFWAAKYQSFPGRVIIGREKLHKAGYACKKDYEEQVGRVDHGELIREKINEVRATAYMGLAGPDIVVGRTYLGGCLTSFECPPPLHELLYQRYEETGVEEDIQAAIYFADYSAKFYPMLDPSDEESWDYSSWLIQRKLAKREFELRSSIPRPWPNLLSGYEVGVRDFLHGALSLTDSYMSQLQRYATSYALGIKLEDYQSSPKDELSVG